MLNLISKIEFRTFFKKIVSLSILCLLLLNPALPIGQLTYAADSDVVGANPENSAVEISNRLEQKTALLKQQIDSLESKFDPFHQSLLEPLQSFTEASMEAGDFEEVGRILKRRLSLLSRNNGPESPTQLPVLEEMIRNDIRLEQWQEVTEAFENIYWIQSQIPEIEIAAVLESLNAISAWHYTAIYLDAPNKRTRHFEDAKEIQRKLLSLAEKEFGEEGSALIPWLYQDALERFRVDAMFRSKDELGDQARTTIVRLESKRTGLSKIKRIRRLIESMGNPEAEAMAMIAEADFLRLLQMSTAPKLYRNAMEKLKAAGINPEKVEDFFARPVVLPEPKFYFSLDEALDARSAYGYTVQSAEKDGENTIHMGNFIAWNESLPYARRPEIPELADSVRRELYSIDMKFTINSVGRVRNPKVELAEPDRVRIKRDAQDAIKAMQFRPKFTNGRGYRTRDVTMRYLYPPPL